MINVFAHSWNLADSYGRVAHETANAIHRTRGVHVNRIGNAMSVIQPTFGGILTAYPSQFALYGPLSEYGRRIALTMFESTEIPHDWIEPLNRCDAVVVTSNWLVEVFRSCGVTAPIHVLHLGVNGDLFKYRERTQRKPFTFLTIGDAGRRKGSHHALFAFLKAFGDSDDYRMIVKARDHVIDRFENNNIEIIKGELSDSELADLYSECDCMVFPTAGEGFGFPPREFAATGGLVITTNWGGTADHIEKWGFPLPYTLEPAWRGESKLNGLGEWAHIDQDHLSTLMRVVANIPHEARIKIGENAAHNIRDLYSWDRFGASIYDIWSGKDGNRDTVQQGS